MSQTFNIYCDESCHLESDHQNVMVLGALWAPLEATRGVAEEIRNIKSRHGLSKKFEIKWTKVSKGKQNFYLELVDYFFQNKDLHFRALVAKDKSKLDHTKYSQTHEDWYYKMYYHLLNNLLSPTDNYRIYLDIKDTRSAAKVRKLQEVLQNAKFDFNRQIITRIQNVASRDVEQIQLTDILIGAVSYVNRGLAGNSGKNSIVNKIKEATRYSLLRTTLMREEKFNIFVWEPRGVNCD